MIIKKPVCFLVLLISFSTFCQQAVVSAKVTHPMAAYNDSYRLHLTEPPYGLKKIQQRTLKVTYGVGDHDSNKKFYQSLSLREKFTYNMIHGESYRQICSAFPVSETDDKKRVYAQLSDLFGEYGWSATQEKFFATYRDSVVYLLNECITKDNEVGLNFKTLIADINAKELVPLLIKTYMVTKKDNDILTLLMLLMKNNKYQPFFSTLEFVQLYGADGNYSASIAFNTATQNFIIKLATEFYHATSK